MFINLLTKLYLIPFRKTSRAKGNDRTDRHILDRFFEIISDTSVGVSNFWLQSRTKYLEQNGLIQ